MWWLRPRVGWLPQGAAFVCHLDLGVSRNNSESVEGRLRDDAPALHRIVGGAAVRGTLIAVRPWHAGELRHLRMSGTSCKRLRLGCRRRHIRQRQGSSRCRLCLIVGYAGKQPPEGQNTTADGSECQRR
jgi:hypothetical protein